MTTVYFVRHAEPNYMNHDDMSRELTEKGMADSKLVTEFLADKNVDVVFSSPYKRSVDTVCGFAESNGLEVQLENDFRERKIDSGWIEDFASFCKAQWADFDYRLSDGETLREVQARNIAALNRVLRAHENKTIVIGSHGTALSTVVNFYDKSFGYEQFLKIQGLMPWVVKFTFRDTDCTEIQPYNLFEVWQSPEYTGRLTGETGRNSMKEDDFVRLMDAYMGCDGYYMKPKIGEDGKSSFFIAKDAAKSSDVGASFELVRETIGVKEEKEPEVFTGAPKVECAVCADIPNLTDIDSDTQ